MDVALNILQTGIGVVAYTAIQFAITSTVARFSAVTKGGTQLTPQGVWKQGGRRRIVEPVEAYSLTTAAAVARSIRPKL